MNPPKKKILVFSSIFPSKRLPSQGPFIFKRVKMLKSLGYDVSVITREYINLVDVFFSSNKAKNFRERKEVLDYSYEGIRVVNIKMRMLMPLNWSILAPFLALIYFKRAAKINSLLMEEYDYVFNAAWGDLAAVGAWYANNKGVPCMSSAIGNYENKYIRSWWSIPYWIIRFTYRRSSSIFCVSDALAKKIGRNRNYSKKVFVHYTGVNIKQFCGDANRRDSTRKRLGLDAQEIIFAFTGRLVASKGIKELIDAFCRLIVEQPQCTLLLVGQINSNKWSSRIKEKISSISSILHIDGCSPDIVPEYLDAADIFVFPSYMEGLPNSVMEACSMSLPVIASRVGGIPEVVQDEANGLLVDPKDTDALFRAMKVLSEDLLKASNMGITGRRIVEKYFDFKKNKFDLKSHIDNEIRIMRNL